MALLKLIKNYLLLNQIWVIKPLPACLIHLVIDLAVDMYQKHNQQKRNNLLLLTLMKP